ncbi:MAG: hypothetical protein ABIY55_23585 [Kofleriaceae bacterium]
MPDEPTKDKTDEPQSRLGRFLTKYATLVSSTVLGIAGLAATSIWQFRQSATAQQQAESQQRVAEMQAQNNWRIERADVLSKNIGTLAASGPDTVEQRYGVLLSLTRGNLLDPELAVSYALELGKDNAEYMQSVLANVPEKDYPRLARAFTVSCQDRFGTAPPIEMCNNKLAKRSEAIATLIEDDGDTALAGMSPGPLVLLKEERPVQLHVGRMSALFAPLLTALYADRKWDAIKKFMAYSNGAHLVAALVLTAARTGEFVTEEEAKQLQQFDDTHARWLATYLTGPTCEAECKSRAMSNMVSHFAAAQGSYDAAVRQLLQAPRAQSGMAVSFLHTRLLWCQVDPADVAALRDHILVPAVIAVLANPHPDASVRDGLFSLVLLTPEPSAEDAPATAAWQAMTAAITKADEKVARTFTDRRATAAHQRLNPPPALKKANFCAAAASPASSDTTATP